MRLLHQNGGEINAQKIIRAMENGRNINLYDVRILGDLDLSDKQIFGDSCSSEAEAKKSIGHQKSIDSMIRINHCILNGIVNLPNTVFLKKVSFEGSRFERGAVFWPRSEFCEEANFSHTSFCGRADFSYVKFKDSVTFQEAVFRKDGHHQVEFSHVRFDGEAGFEGTIFARKVIFLGSRFRDSADFSFTTFYEDGQFDDVRFYETSWFYNCKFKANAKFNHVTFYRDAIFSHSTFEKNIIINGSRAEIIYFEGFENKRLLKSESRIGIADIRNINELIYKLYNEQNEINLYIKSKFSVKINDLISTYDATNQLHPKNRVRFLKEFNDIIFDPSFLKDNSFSGIKLSKMTKILMEQADGDHRLSRLLAEDIYPDLIRKNETLFGVKLNSETRIFLEGSYFNLLKIHWHILENYLDKDTTPSVYLSLIRGYKELGWTRDEDDCYYAYRLLRDNSKISKLADKLYNKTLSYINLSKYLDPIASISCGYGVRPARTLSLSFAVILTYAFIFLAKFTFWQDLLGDGLVDRNSHPLRISVVKLSDEVFQTAYLGNNHLTSPSLLDSIQSIPGSLYLSSMTFISQVPSNWYIGGYWKYVVMSERIIGWLLMALFIVVLTKKLIR